jgi:hypothetical protein
MTPLFQGIKETLSDANLGWKSAQGLRKCEYPCYSGAELSLHVGSLNGVGYIKEPES